MADRFEDSDGPDGVIEAIARNGSDINESGLAAQIACILAHNGATEGLRMVREAAGLEMA